MVPVRVQCQTYLLIAVDEERPSHLCSAAGYPVPSVYRVNFGFCCYASFLRSSFSFTSFFTLKWSSFVPLKAVHSSASNSPKCFSGIPKEMNCPPSFSLLLNFIHSDVIRVGFSLPIRLAKTSKTSGFPGTQTEIFNNFGFFGFRLSARTTHRFSPV